jgi:hypothetical protein
MTNHITFCQIAADNFTVSARRSAQPDFHRAISRAIWVAYQRSLELGKEQEIHILEGNLLPSMD